MLSDKEKKAIELLEDHLICGNKEGVLYRNLRIISRIIEKQQKEIEELREEKAKRQWVHIKENGEVEPLFYVSKDKIKAKIEELQEDIKYSANPLSIDNSKFGIKVLQSLLEKE